VTAAHPIRVLHVITSLVFGGAERLVVSAATLLPAARFESVICCLAMRGPLAAKAERAGVRVESLGVFPGLRHPLAFLRLYRLIRRLRPDVVHTHLQAANLYGRFAAWLAGVPVIVATEHNLYASKAGRYVRVERLLARRTTMLVAVSDQVRRFLSEQLQLPVSSIRVIRNGVGEPTASHEGPAALRSRLGILPDDVVLATVASLTAKKGHEFLIRAVAILRDRGVGCSLVLAGEGPERPRLESLAAALQLSTRVHFLGAIDGPADVLAIADLFVLPSVVEGLPLALLEAMMAAKPVIATSVGGVPEVVVSDQNGILVPPRSADALACAIERLVASPEMRDALGRSARVTAETAFTERHYVDSLSELYAELTSDSLHHHPGA
jgi:glycosyltransferase involved in cell wall biosynthesis